MTRRTSLILVVVSVVLVITAGVLVAGKWFEMKTLRIGAGDKDGVTYAFAHALADIVAARSNNIRIEVLETKGSEDNIDQLQEKRVDLAVVQNDVRATPDARTIAFLYPQLFHLIASTGSGIESVSDLEGKRVGTPPAGGGSHKSFLELMRHYQLSAESFSVLRTLSSGELTKAFLRGELDAVFRNDVIGDERTVHMLHAGKAKIVTIDQGAAMRLRRPYLEVFTMPKGSYRANPPIPAEDVQTVGVQTALLANRSLDALVVREITQLLFDHRLDLMAKAPAAAWVSSPVNAPSLSMAIHEGAKLYYEREKPPFMVMYAEVITLCLTIAAMLASSAFAVRLRVAARSKKRADHFNFEICRLVDDVENAPDLMRLEVLKKELFGIFRAVMQALDHDQISGNSIESFVFAWQTALSCVERRESVLAVPRAHSAAGPTAEALRAA
jgi:uncharacterized protein